MLCWINKEKICRFEYRREQPKSYKEFMVNVLLGSKRNWSKIDKIDILKLDSDDVEYLFNQYMIFILNRKF